MRRGAPWRNTFSCKELLRLSSSSLPICNLHPGGHRTIICRELQL